MLHIEETVLVIIDVQGKLGHLMYEKEQLFTNLQRLARAAKVLDIPVLWNEQYPQGLGPTIPELSAELQEIANPIIKCTFSSCGAAAFMESLKALGRKQILIAGIETHVCIYQTAVDLVKLGYQVEVVADAVSSRTKENKQIGLEKMKEKGASWTSTEMALFELVKVAEGAKFKAILEIVK